ncbi:endospore germination permease [Paenibacillus chartarius]|uniref:Endospore germination permease n=1 Tax=Paenibacillus chartarius TaxID=747481 RepID=A0ABV6DV00_9BACL
MSKLTPKLSDLVVTFVLFEVGSTTLFLLGGKAKQDAWLVMLIGAIFGFMLVLLYLWIHRLDRSRDLFELLFYYLETLPGRIIGGLYVCYFLYEASRNLRDLGELTVLTLLNRTPIAFVMLVAIVVISNTVRYGAEVLMQTCTALFPITVAGYALLLSLIAAAGMIHMENMLPILENGWKPVWDNAFPEVVSFPFGQTVLFLVLFKITEHSSGFSKAIIWAYSIVSFVLILLNQISILVLGPELASNFTLPLLETVQLIRFPQILERMDALFALILYLGLGIKIAAFFIASVTGLHRITTIKYKLLIIPAAAVIYASSFLSPRYVEYVWAGLNLTVVWISPVFQIILPLMLLTVMLLRKEKRSQTSQSTGAERPNRI